MWDRLMVQKDEMKKHERPLIVPKKTSEIDSAGVNKDEESDALDVHQKDK